MAPVRTFDLRSERSSLAATRCCAVRIVQFLGEPAPLILSDTNHALPKLVGFQLRDHAVGYVPEGAADLNLPGPVELHSVDRSSQRVLPLHSIR